jgi:oligopeptide transport system ATP-binding protein
MPEIILEVQNLKKFFPKKKGLFSKTKGILKAVDGVNFKIESGRTLGLVGESGCGKSTLARMILLLLEPTEGKIIYRGKELSKDNFPDFKLLRKKIQIIFQDPYSSLNPQISVGKMLSEILKYHNISGGDASKKRISELLEKVGLKKEDINKYPHEFSGGQRQRICIARALSVEPEFIICDEPVSALDVSIQAQIINLLIDLQRDYDLTYLFISHDLSVVKHISDNICIMYLGKIVEMADSKSIFDSPKHPYTISLLSSVLEPGRNKDKKKNSIKGDITFPPDDFKGCDFFPRCKQSFRDCEVLEPQLDSNDGHLVRCLLYKESYQEKNNSIKGDVNIKNAK